MLVKREFLYLIAALIWGIPGAIITTKGIMAYGALPLHKQWWLIGITACVVVFFFFVFRRIVKQYCARIAELPERTTLWQTFPLRGWLLIVFMIGLGITIKYIPTTPLQFTASFYSGLGPMLLLAATKFIRMVAK